MNRKLAYYFNLAAQVAIGGDIARNFLIGSVGTRKDGVIVSARNGAVFSTDTENYKTIPSAHSEFRICSKLTPGSIVYVARVSRVNGGKRKDGSPLFAMSKPCDTCRMRLISVGVRKAYFTIDADSWGVMDLTS